MTTGDGLTIGIDVGGTKIAAGLVTADGELRAHARHESPAADATAIVGAIGDLVEKLIGSAEGQGEKVVGAGVAAAGFIDKERSNVIFAPNLAWRDEPLRAHLEQRVGLPVVVENDANAAAWGEFRFGAAADVDDLLLVTVGTGIGGGIVIDGNVLRGGFGFGAEVGHMCVVPEGRPCGCGNRGCWEQYCSGNALVRDTREAVTDPAAQALVEAEQVKAQASIQKAQMDNATRLQVEREKIASQERVAMFEARERIALEHQKAALHAVRPQGVMHGA